MLKFIIGEWQEKKNRNRSYYFFVSLLFFNYYVLKKNLFALYWKFRHNLNSSDADMKKKFKIPFRTWYFLLALWYLKTLFSIIYKAIFRKQFRLFLWGNISLLNFIIGEWQEKTETELLFFYHFFFLNYYVLIFI